MLSLVVLDNPRLAQAYIDYMACQGIEIQMAANDVSHITLWVINDEDRLQAQTELTHFLAHPNDVRYAQASWDRGETKDLHLLYRSANLWSLIRSKAGPVTLFIMLLCVGIYSLKILGFGPWAFYWLHFPAIESEKWQLWRWVSHALFHFSVVHIVFNLLWWWQLGGDIEKKLGSATLTLLFVVSAVLSGVAQYWADGPNFGGLSGVVYALVGYIWIIGWQKPAFGLSMSKPIIGFMLVWLVFGFIQPIMAIANTAHLVGLVCGVVLAGIETRFFTLNK